MSNGTYVDGSTNSDAWGFGLKAGYDFKLGDAGYATLRQRFWSVPVW